MSRKEAFSKFASKRNLSHNQKYIYSCIIKNKINRNFLTNHLYFYLMIFIIFSSIIKINNIKCRIYFNIISNDNRITMKVKGIGNTLIFYSSLYPQPSKIILNGTEIPVNYNIYLSYSKNTVILEWSSRVSNCEYMFQNCDQILEIDLSKSNSSLVNRMNYMFSNCISLTSINFKNFGTSKITYMQYIFQNCYSLISLDLSSFVTNQVSDFHHMFDNCKSLIYVNLSSFKTTSCECLQSMFYGCSALTSLDLSTFTTSLVYRIYNMFYGCEKLEYVNLKNSVLGSYLLSYSNHYYGVANKTAKNIVFCVKEESFNNYRNYILKDNPCSVLISDCNSDWRKHQKKLIQNTNNCVDNCSSTSYKYEYQGKCYSQCPSGTYKINYICYDCNQDCKECLHKDDCISCTDSNKFLRNGRCISSCDNGYYISKEDQYTKICECYLPQCKICSLESKNQNLCVTCNDNFFPIYKAQNTENEFLEYHISIEGYYLDKINNQYYFMKCFNSCQICNETGSSQYHNCLSCKSDYEFEIEFNGYKNCYKNCDKYYYLDNYNNLYCTSNYNCPDNYDKLIKDKKECIKACNSDKKYKYEFRKECYENCPERTQENETSPYFCDVKCTKEFPLEIIETQN